MIIVVVVAMRGGGCLCEKSHHSEGDGGFHLLLAAIESPLPFTISPSEQWRSMSVRLNSGHGDGSPRMCKGSADVTFDPCWVMRLSSQTDRKGRYRQC